jgi:hypothetical protein
MDRENKAVERDRKRVITQGNLQLPLFMTAAGLSIPCTLARNARYCKSCSWAKWICGCTQMRSSRLLLINLDLFSL